MFGTTPRPATIEFASSTRRARRVLIIEIAGLGDLVHSLPSMWAVRQTYPDAELHCITRHNFSSLMSLTPWIDRVLPYARGREADIRYQWSMARELRRQKYDLTIDLIGSDHSSVMSWLSGAPRRLVRRPGNLRPRYAWKLLATDVVEQPLRQSPMYLQRWLCLRQAGFETATPEFELDWNSDAAQMLGVDDADGPRYVHVSPFARGTHKEMPQTMLARLLVRLNQQVPEIRFVFSCSPSPRERLALEELLAALPFKPWKVFAGSIDIPQLCALIHRAALHLSGDSGSMHLAWLVGAHSVSWFLNSNSMLQWAPQGAQHTAVSIDPMREPDAGVDAILAHALRLLSDGTQRAPVAKMRRFDEQPMAAQDR